MKNKLFIILIMAFIPIVGTAQPHMEGQMQEAGTPFYHVDVNRFPTEYSDSIEVVVYMKVPYDDLQFVKFDSLFRAQYEISIVAFDKEGVQVDSKIEKNQVDLETFELTNAVDLYDQSRYRFQLYNSVYEFSVGLMDLDTRKTTYRKLTVNLLDFNEDEVRMSDLLLVDNITESDTSETTFIPNVVNKLDTKQTKFYGYFVAAGPEGPAYIDAKIMSGDGKETIQTVQDTIQLTDKPTRKFIPMEPEGLNYAKYIFQVDLTYDENTVTRKKEFRVAWVGLTDFVGNLDQAIEQMIYVLPMGEINKMKKADPEEKKKMFMDYWKKRDPTPQTETNELMNEYYRRVSYANEEFGSSLKNGWRTDMGMVYILFGAPNDIERHPFDIGSKPYQIWYYWEINRQLVFIDETGFGDYRLVTPIHDFYNSPF